MNYVPSTSSTLSTLDVQNLRRTAWSTKYKQDSVRPSIFTALKTDFKVMQSGDVIITKPGLVLDVSNLGKAQVGGGQAVRIALRKPLTAAPQMGNGEDMLGKEDETDLLYCTLYYNEIKKAIKFNNWGYDYNDLEYLNYNEGYSAYMGLYWQELDDYRIQNALLMRYSPELVEDPVGMVQTFNKNWAIPNSEEADYPAWAVSALTQTDGSIDTTKMPDGTTSIGYYPDMYFSGTFVDNIATSMLAASGTGSTPKATLKVGAILQIMQYIVDQHVVEPLMIGGEPMYIWKMPPKVYQWMINNEKTGSLGAWWQAVARYQGDLANRMVYPGEVGTLGGNFIVVLDTRCPTLTVGGTQGAYTLTPGYIRPGNIDERNNSAWSNTSGSTNYVFDITTIMGAQAIAKYTRDDLKLGLVQFTEYEKRQGRGSYKGEGIQLPIYDKGTATATSGIYRGSCVVPVSRDSIQTIS